MDNNFRHNLKQLLDMEKRIKEMKQALKIYNNKKKSLEKSIKHHMLQKNLTKIKLPDGVILSTYTRKSRQGCSKKFVQGRMEMYCQQKHLSFDEMNDYIYNLQYRQVKEIICLRRTKDKKK